MGPVRVDCYRSPNIGGSFYMALFSGLFGAKTGANGTGRSATPKQKPRYAGVEIIPQKGACCSAVRATAGQRFLTNEAPLMPLPNCDMAQCNCRYRQVPERRTDIRRDADVGIGSAMAMFREDCQRTMGPGRRARD